MANLRIWPSIIGGFVAMGLNWANVASVGPVIVIPAGLHFSGFLNGFLIVFMALTVVDIYKLPRIFRRSSYIPTTKIKETLSESNTQPKKDSGESNK